ncbi:hypothetical protein R6Q59_013365 [Mikania micrantha]
MDIFVLFSLGWVLSASLWGLCWFDGDAFGSWDGLDFPKTHKRHGFLFNGPGWFAGWLYKLMFWLFSRLYRGWVHLGWIGDGLSTWVWKVCYWAAVECWSNCRMGLFWIWKSD